MFYLLSLECILKKRICLVRAAFEPFSFYCVSGIGKTHAIPNMLQ